MCATKAPKNFASPFMMQQMGSGQPPSVFEPGVQPATSIGGQQPPGPPNAPDLTGDAGPPAADDQGINNILLRIMRAQQRGFGDAGRIGGGRAMSL